MARSSIHVCGAFVVALVIGGAVEAQEVRDYGITRRGRVPDTQVMEDARVALDRAGVACSIEAARLRGRDERRVPQFEVTCREGPGYLVVGDTDAKALSCLVLESQRDRARRDSQSTKGSRCELRANQIVLPLFAAMGAQAGLTCKIDGGRFVGFAPSQGEIYEIGCADESGAWIEKIEDGWMTKDCLLVSAQGGQCVLTNHAEIITSFAPALSDSDLAGCDLRSVRAMGSDGLDRYYEVLCASRESAVVRFDGQGALAEVIACALADRIGDGCQFSARPRMN